MQNNFLYTPTETNTKNVEKETTTSTSFLYQPKKFISDTVSELIPPVIKRGSLATTMDKASTAVTKNIIEPLQATEKNERLVLSTLINKKRKNKITPEELEKLNSIISNFTLNNVQIAGPLISTTKRFAPFVLQKALQTEYTPFAQDISQYPSELL